MHQLRFQKSFLTIAHMPAGYGNLLFFIFCIPYRSTRHPSFYCSLFSVYLTEAPDIPVSIGVLCCYFVLAFCFVVCGTFVLFMSLYCISYFDFGVSLWYLQIFVIVVPFAYMKPFRSPEFTPGF